MNKALFGLLALVLVGAGGYYFFNNPAPGNVANQTEPAALAARKDLAAKLSIPEASITIVRVEEKTWSNGCLGLAKAEEFCTEALVPGFRVELQAQGTTHVYRTDKLGFNIRAE